MVIYLIRNKINGKEYVGQTVQSLERRWQIHLCGKQQAIDLAIKKYGAENFELSTLAWPRTLEEMNVGEEAHIFSRHTIAPKGCNLLPGGNNHRPTSETRAKLRASRAGQIRPSCTEETKLKMRLAHLGKPGTMLGKKFTQEHRKKLSIAAFKREAVRRQIRASSNI